MFSSCMFWTIPKCDGKIHKTYSFSILFYKTQMNVSTMGKSKIVLFLLLPDGGANYLLLIG